MFRCCMVRRYDTPKVDDPHPEAASRQICCHRGKTTSEPIFPRWPPLRPQLRRHRLRLAPRRRDCKDFPQKCQTKVVRLCPSCPLVKTSWWQAVMLMPVIQSCFFVATTTPPSSLPLAQQQPRRTGVRPRAFDYLQYQLPQCSLSVTASNASHSGNGHLLPPLAFLFRDGCARHGGRRQPLGPEKHQDQPVRLGCC